VAYLNTQVNLPTALSSHQISWNTLVILVSSMILQTPPRRMLAAALVAASMDPLGVWVAGLRGRPVPPLWDAVVAYLPNYVCAVLAMLPSSVLQHVGRRLREAQEFGSYRLVELLGHGGMGEVWRAEHRMLRRDVAIKLVRPEVLGASDADGARVVLQRFEREARATAALSSPHTIDVFDYGMTDDRTLYYAMELLQGRDLETLVREFGPVPADRSLFLLRQVCHSLADAHARGLVHRDVKPANIYVCRKGLDYDFVKARRCLCPRMCRVLLAHRSTRVRGRHPDEDASSAPPGAPRAPLEPHRTAHSTRGRRVRAGVPRKGSQQPAARRESALGAGLQLQSRRDDVESGCGQALVGDAPAGVDWSAVPQRTSA
jgi:hypothetical protein